MEQPPGKMRAPRAVPFQGLTVNYLEGTRQIGRRLFTLNKALSELHQQEVLGVSSVRC